MADHPLPNVAQAFFNRVSDPAIGGTYMTMLNTFANLGGSWVRDSRVRQPRATAAGDCRGRLRA
eukprot:2699538-Prymnesium_polylepis.1